MKKYIIASAIIMMAGGAAHFFGFNKGKKQQQIIYENEIAKEQSRLFGQYQAAVKKNNVTQSLLASARLDAKQQEKFITEVLSEKKNKSYSKCVRPEPIHRLRVQQFCSIAEQTDQPMPAACGVTPAN